MSTGAVTFAKGASAKGGGIGQAISAVVGGLTGSGGCGNGTVSGKKGFQAGNKCAGGRDKNSPVNRASVAHRAARAVVSKHSKAGTIGTKEGRAAVKASASAHRQLQAARQAQASARSGDRKAATAVKSGRASALPAKGTPAPAPAPAPTPKPTIEKAVKASAKESADVLTARAATHLNDLHAGAAAGALKPTEIHAHVERIGRGATKDQLFAAAKSAGIEHSATTKKALVAHLKDHAHARNEAAIAAKTATAPKPTQAPAAKTVPATPKAKPVDDLHTIHPTPKPGDGATTAGTRAEPIPPRPTPKPEAPSKPTPAPEEPVLLHRQNEPPAKLYSDRVEKQVTHDIPLKTMQKDIGNHVVPFKVAHEKDGVHQVVQERVTPLERKDQVKQADLENLIKETYKKGYAMGDFSPGNMAYHNGKLKVQDLDAFTSARDFDSADELVGYARKYYGWDKPQGAGAEPAVKTAKPAKVAPAPKATPAAPAKTRGTVDERAKAASERATAKVRAAEVEKRKLIHDQGGLNRNITPEQIAQAQRHDRTAQRLSGRIDQIDQTRRDLSRAAAKGAPSSKAAVGPKLQPHEFKATLGKIHGGDVDDRRTTVGEVARHSGRSEAEVEATVRDLGRQGALSFDHATAADLAMAKGYGKFPTDHEGKPYHGFRVDHPRKFEAATSGGKQP
jgi:hypothetical protein